MTQRIVVVDAFTDRPFAGNPAAVCVLPKAADERWMQRVAAEMNLAETAFLHREGAAYRLRWFTPTVEVDLCGHATLASAHVLWEDGLLPLDAVARFETRSGTLSAARQESLIELDFPATTPEAAPPPEGLLDALAVRPVWVGRSKFDYLVEVETEAVVRKLAPDIGALGRISTRGVIVTSRASGTEYDFVSRFFAPAAGVPEDPVTGSAHCALAPYWTAKLGRTTLTGYQASTRGGVVRMRQEGGRVVLGGHAVTVLKGVLEC